MRISDWSSDVCSSDLSALGSGHCRSSRWRSHGEGDRSLKASGGGAATSRHSPSVSPMGRHLPMASPQGGLRPLPVVLAVPPLPFVSSEVETPVDLAPSPMALDAAGGEEVGRASWWERVCEVV